MRWLLILVLLATTGCWFYQEQPLLGGATPAEFVQPVVEKGKEAAPWLPFPFDLIVSAAFGIAGKALYDRKNRT